MASISREIEICLSLMLLTVNNNIVKNSNIISMLNINIINRKTNSSAIFLSTFEVINCLLFNDNVNVNSHKPFLTINLLTLTEYQMYPPFHHFLLLLSFAYTNLTHLKAITTDTWVICWHVVSTIMTPKCILFAAFISNPAGGPRTIEIK